MVEIFTDGACKGNPGVGGWGVLLRSEKLDTQGRPKERRLFGGEAETTNNRMELKAVIEGLQTLKKPCRVVLTTDSKYVKLGFEEWLPGWKNNNWRTKSGTAVKNQDLWQELDKTARGHQIEWHWVKGHSDHPENEIADQLANQGVAETIRKIKKGS